MIDLSTVVSASDRKPYKKPILAVTVAADIIETRTEKLQLTSLEVAMHLFERYHHSLEYKLTEIEPGCDLIEEAIFELAEGRFHLSENRVADDLAYETEQSNEFMEQVVQFLHGLDGLKKTVLLEVK